MGEGKWWKKGERGRGPVRYNVGTLLISTDAKKTIVRVVINTVNNKSKIT